MESLGMLETGYLKDAGGAVNRRSEYRLPMGGGNAGVGFDFDLPGGGEESGDDDHRGGGTNGGEELAVDTAYGFPVGGAGEVDAGAVDVLDGAAGLLESGGDEGEALGSLLGCIGCVGSDRAGSGDVDVVADADGAGEADDGLVGAGAGDVLAVGGSILHPGSPCGWLPVPGGSRRHRRGRPRSRPRLLRLHR
jgi:hypothetical protein